VLRASRIRVELEFNVARLGLGWVGDRAVDGIADLGTQVAANDALNVGRNVGHGDDARVIVDVAKRVGQVGAGDGGDQSLTRAVLVEAERDGMGGVDGGEGAKGEVGRLWESVRDCVRAGDAHRTLRDIADSDQPIAHKACRRASRWGRERAYLVHTKKTVSVLQDLTRHANLTNCTPRRGHTGGWTWCSKVFCFRFC